MNCGAGIPFTVTVTVNPMATIAAMSTTICSGLTFTLTPTHGVNGVIPTGTLYSWSSPAVTGGITGGITVTNAADINGTLINPTNIAQTATYTVTPLSGNCTGTVFSVTITLNPVATVTSMTTVTCSGVAFTMTPTHATNGIIPAGTTFTWSAPTGSGFTGGLSQSTGVIAINGLLTNITNAAVTATYLVTPLSGNCTGAAFTAVVTISPVASVTAMTTTVCTAVSFNVTPTNGMNGIVPLGTTYTWSAPTGFGFTGGASQVTPATDIFGLLTNTQSFSITATYIVSPVSGACAGNAFTLTVTVDPGTTVHPMTETTCSGVIFTVTPTDGVNGTIPNGTLYTWTVPTGTGFTGGASQTVAVGNISGTLVNTTNAAVTALYVVTPTTACGSSISFTLLITINPAATITAMSTTTCSGVAFNVTPVNGTDGIVPAGTLYTWTTPTGVGFTGGVSQTTAVNTIIGTLVNTTNTTKTATYIVTPITVNCGAGLPFTVTVNISPIASITDMTTITCSGCSVCRNTGRGCERNCTCRNIVCMVCSNRSRGCRRCNTGNTGE